MGKAHSPEILSVNAYNECLSRLLHEKGLKREAEKLNADLVFVPEVITSELPDPEHCIS